MERFMREAADDEVIDLNAKWSLGVFCPKINGDCKAPRCAAFEPAYKVRMSFGVLEDYFVHPPRCLCFKPSPLEIYGSLALENAGDPFTISGHISHETYME